MAKRKTNRRTPEEQAAFDERTRMIDAHLERRRRDLEARKLKRPWWHVLPRRRSA
jgi:hypothetical protein